jgi:hypothetical protein
MREDGSACPVKYIEDMERSEFNLGWLINSVALSRVPFEHLNRLNQDVKSRILRGCRSTLT